MARVVTHRTAPPYLLIVMVFLFLIAATLAVLGWMESDKAKKRVAIAERTRQKLGDSADLRNAKVQQMMDLHDSPPRGQRPKTVVKQFQTQVDALVEYLIGQVKDAKVAMNEAEEALEQIGGSRGLIGEALDLHRQLALARQQLKEKDQLLAAKQQQIDNKARMAEKMSRDLEARITELQTKVQDLDKQLSDRHQQYQKELEQARLEWDRQRDELNKRIAINTQDREKLRAKNQQLEHRIRELTEELQRKTQPQADPMKMAMQPDGKIMKVPVGSGLCYINLGSKDRATPGLTFTVYPPTGIPEDGKGKAAIVVTRVGPNTSECRIEQQRSDDPVMVNDLVANLAFDSTRTYTFVVEGHFDLYGTGRPTLDDTDHAKVIIKRFGGKVVDEVGFDTDFIVLGSPPPIPTEPREGASSQELAAYRASLKKADRYNNVKALAQSINIPILSANRFLAFIGYVPSGLER